MAAWKLGPALAAGNAVVLKPAESTPISILVLMEMVGSILPPGVLNIVNGYGREAGMPLASSKRIAKIAFTGSTAVGKLIGLAAAQNLIPATLELGGKSPNVFFADVMDQDDAYFDKVLEGFALFAFNSGEVCTCPSRALIEESIYDAFMARALARVAAIKMGSPLDPATMLGAQCSQIQLDRIMGYIKVGKDEGAAVLCGGERAALPGGEVDGYYVQPTVFKGHNKMRVFQEEIFGPVLAVTTFRDEAEAIALANDTQYGLGAGVWTRDGSRMHRMGRAIKAGRVWVSVRPLAADPRASPHSSSLAVQQLSRVPRGCRVRRVQGEWPGPRDARERHPRVSADQEPPRVLLAQRPRLLLRRGRVRRKGAGRGPAEVDEHDVYSFHGAVLEGLHVRRATQGLVHDERHDRVWHQAAPSRQKTLVEGQRALTTHGRAQDSESRGVTRPARGHEARLCEV
jgi:hypothetical protein